ncbi:MAG: diguanylate cyclase [Gammaproteobacteria bacterium]|uniref:diguanylate cyclase n=2 Tax=Xanthomonas boreopolis TaxID=86183 RepID=A0A919F6J3_9XANT|nr:sensor domain-containing diguanylate cyclase [Pseudomonas sp. Hp2]GHH50174.1 diguanylate cyclase AdrA [[Pseudomonas] boreopolis]
MSSEGCPTASERCQDGTAALVAGTDDARRRALAFVKRVYPMRNLGLLLLALPYVSVLHEHHAGWHYWVLAGLNVLVWPHVAFLRAYSSRDPKAAEFRNLVLDAVFGGFWIAASKVSLVPAAAMISILMADRLSAGSWPLLGRAALAGLASFLLSAWMLDWPFQPEASKRTMLLSLPPVLVYMLALSHVSYQLARRISRQNRELERLILTDTGVDLPNRRHFNAKAGELIAAARAGAGDTVLLLIDVDRFKSINDRHGHGMGDEVLREIARLLREQAGSDGFPARIGGDEFALLLPVGLPDGERAASRLRRAASELALPHWSGLQVGVSIGVAALASHHRGLDDWMSAADRAMYVAKAAGRFRP